MFWPDIVQLKEFYASPLGQIAARVIGKRVRGLWPNVRGEKILGIGFTPPVLDFFMDEAERTLALMPAPQGAMYWPPSRPNRSFLAHEAQIPLPDNSVGRIVMMHVMENSQNLSLLIKEAWRVLAPSGKLLAIAANRHGIWSRAPSSPFSYGQPFSPAQLRKVFSESEFTCGEVSTHLFMPPGDSPLLHRWANMMETLGRWCCVGLGGVVIMEAEKQLYAMRNSGVKAGLGSRIYAPAAKPAMTLSPKGSR